MSSPAFAPLQHQGPSGISSLDAATSMHCSAWSFASIAGCNWLVSYHCCCCHAWSKIFNSNKQGGQATMTIQSISKLPFQRFLMPAGDAIQVAWIGHATALVQMDGCTFLTDPLFSQRAGPWNMLGPRQVCSHFVCVV